nr:immunoglobulin light chain junction region [Macaca mulatta]
CQQYNSDSYSF